MMVVLHFIWQQKQEFTAKLRHAREARAGARAAALAVGVLRDFYILRDPAPRAPGDAYLVELG